MVAQHYSSGFVSTTLGGNLAGVTAGTSGSVVVASVTGLPTLYPFTLVVEYGAAAQEVVTVTQAATGTGPYTFANCVRGDDGSTAPAHNAGVVVVHGVSARDFANRLNVQSVLAWGADDTGTSDSTTAFSKAISALPTGGGTVYVPAGTYKITAGQLVAASGLHVIGDGFGCTTINAAAGGSYFMNMDPVSGGVEDLLITGLTINATGMDIFWGANLWRSRIVHNKLVQNSNGNCIFNVSVSTGRGTTLMQECLFNNEEYINGAVRTIEAWHLDFSGSGQACNDCIWDGTGYKQFISNAGDTTHYWLKLIGANAGTHGSRGNKFRDLVFELINGTGGLLHLQNVAIAHLERITSEDLGATTVGNPLILLDSVSAGDGCQDVFIRGYSRRGGSGVSGSVPDIKIDQYGTQILIDSPSQSSGGTALTIDAGNCTNLRRAGAWPQSYSLLNAAGLSPARASFSPGAPASTTSTTQLMMGLGSTCTFTPQGSGQVLAIISGTADTATATAQIVIAARYGTGTAPANAAAATGTQFGNSPKTLFPGGLTGGVGFTFNDLISLTAGTTYWLDVSLKTGNAADAASVAAVSVTLVELS